MTNLWLCPITFCLALLITGAIGRHCDLGKTPCSSGDACYSVMQRCNGISDCRDLSDEINCTSSDISQHLIITGYKQGEENLAWLVTPIIFAIGMVYALYKCGREGLCIMRQRRRQAESHDRRYLGLDRISFYAMARIPCTSMTAGSHASSQQHLMLVHNHSFSVSLREGVEGEEQVPCMAGAPPSYEEALAGGEGLAMLIDTSTQNDDELPPYTEAVGPAYRPQPPPLPPLAPPGGSTYEDQPQTPPPSFEESQKETQTQSHIPVRDS